jgi:hypothetical protein
MNKTERARCEALHAHKAVHGHLTELVLHQNTSNTTEPPCIPPAIRQVSQHEKKISFKEIPLSKRDSFDLWRNR